MSCSTHLHVDYSRLLSMFWYCIYGTWSLVWWRSYLCVFVLTIEDSRCKEKGNTIVACLFELCQYWCHVNNVWINYNQLAAISLDQLVGYNHGIACSPPFLYPRGSAPCMWVVHSLELKLYILFPSDNVLGVANQSGTKVVETRS